VRTIRTNTDLPNTDLPNTFYMKHYFVIIIAAITLLGCHKDELVCLSPCLLETAGNLSDCERARITAYLFLGSIAYHIDPGYCLGDDEAYVVLDSNCELIGQLGGFAGNEEVNGVHFFNNAQLLDIVWEKE
jgi:hypothetical protein